MSNRIERVTIVGGGTAGWLTALMLQTELNPSSNKKNVEITLVESPNIPAIGGGEATRITLPSTLREFGINEREFIMDPSGNLTYRFTQRPRLGDNPGDD